ncbi:MAG: hypothetical protein ACOC0P_06695 [Planctomycetota bacterium]
MAIGSHVVMSALATVASAAVTIGTTPDLARGLFTCDSNNSKKAVTEATAPACTPHVDVGNADQGTVMRVAEFHTIACPGLMSSGADDQSADEVPVDGPVTNVMQAATASPVSSAAAVLPGGAASATVSNTASTPVLSLGLTLVLGINALIGVFLHAFLNDGVFRSDDQNHEDWQRFNQSSAVGATSGTG